jgi:hypothetical protein
MGIVNDVCDCARGGCCMMKTRVSRDTPISPLHLSSIIMSVHHVTIAHPSPKRPALHRTSRNGLTIVLKLGTSSICDEKTHRPLLANLSLVVETIIKLRELGHRVILVTSGAVGMGLRRLNMPTKPTEIAKKQVGLTDEMIMAPMSSHSCITQK